MNIKGLLRLAAILIMAITAGVLISRATNSSANCAPNKCAQCPSASGCAKK